jgi:hypothetical protein
MTDRSASQAAGYCTDCSTFFSADFVRVAPDYAADYGAGRRTCRSTASRLIWIRWILGSFRTRTTTRSEREKRSCEGRKDKGVSFHTTE